jgi:hypothetical protein
MIEKGSDLCENVGIAYVDYMGIERGRYKLYFMRIENEQRIMYNSRLGLLGASSAFSVNNVVSLQEDSSRRISLKDLVGGERKQAKNILLGGSDGGFSDSSELDSMILMNQMMPGHGSSNTQSIHSSDNT